MSIAKTIIWSIVLYVFVQVLIVVADRLSPMTVLFHQTLLTAIQWLLILWIVYSILFGWLFFRNKKGRPMLRMVLVFVSLLVVGEILCAVALRNPSSIPGFALKAFNQYYIHIHRNVIQVVDECSEYDAQFYYKLRPDNTCTFSNLEYNNKVVSNSRGLRDDNPSLSAPEVVALGDSYTMGVGVEQEEAYPAQLEKMSGKKVLNAGMSSFGTVRELRMLHSIDSSNLKAVVIQYCANDIDENQVYEKNNGEFKVSSKGAYDSLVSMSKWGKKYFPGKYLLTVVRYFVKGTVKQILGRKDGGDPSNTSPQRHAKLFLDILKNSKLDFAKTQVIVMDLNDYENQDSGFIESVNSLLKDSVYSSKFVNNVQTLDTKKLLDRSDYYLLDDHVRASAHQKIAKALQGMLK